MHDMNGTELKVGDKVYIPATVLETSASEEFCNVKLEFRNSPAPKSDPERRDYQWMNTNQVFLSKRKQE